MYMLEPTSQRESCDSGHYTCSMYMLIVLIVVMIGTKVKTANPHLEYLTHPPIQIKSKYYKGYDDTNYYVNQR